MTKVVPTVHVVDDDEPFRSAIGELLSACGYKVSLYETAKKLLETPLSGSPACILLDVQMAGLSGPQLQGQLSALGCRLPIVFISAHGDIPTTVQTIKAGAEDFLTKPVTKDKLLEEIVRLQALFGQLTPREREVFGLLMHGRPHKQIAFELGISERTVKLHRHQLVQKLKIRSLAELAVIAERLGLLAEHNGELQAKAGVSTQRQPISDPT